MKLSFDYDSSSNEQVATVGALYRVRMIQDSGAENPWESWDGNIPLFVSYDRSTSEYGADLDPFDHVSDAMLRRHMRAITAAIGGTVTDYFGVTSVSMADYIAQDARDNQRNWGGSLTEYKRDALREAFAGLSTSDQMEAAAEIYNLTGIPACCTSSSGYSQSCYAELLLVATPDWCNAMGIQVKRHDWKRDFERAAALYGAWAWGDVYGYVAERATSWDDDGDGDAWDEIDSCWGFYGDADESGLAESAGAAIAADMATLPDELKARHAESVAALRELVAVRGEAPPLARQEIQQLIASKARDARRASVGLRHLSALN